MILILIIAVIIIAFLMGGCASTSPLSLSAAQTQAALNAGRPLISPQNLTCRPEPRSPGAQATDGQAATFVLDLVSAGRDCRSRLQAVRETLEGMP